MAKSVKRGKALVASLRAQAGVRDPEALAAYLGRFKKARKAGKSVAAAKAAANGNGSSSKGKAAPTTSKNPQKRSPFALGNKPPKGQRAKEDFYHKQYQTFHAGTTGKRTSADEMPLRKGMEVQLKKTEKGVAPTGNFEVVDVVRPNSVKVKDEIGDVHTLSRTNMLLVLPKYYKNKKNANRFR